MCGQQKDLCTDENCKTSDKAAKSLFTSFMLVSLRAYQLSLSPVLFSLGVRCRHLPTCSNYGMQACRKYGGWIGGWILLARFLRCQPFGSSGYDPVPDIDQKYHLQPWKNADWSWRAR